MQEKKRKIKAGERGKIILKDEERQACEVWTRVMGYFRPVSEFNVGKKQEYKDRETYKMKKKTQHQESFVCSECAKAKGGNIPQGNQVTMHQGTCPYCKQDKPLCSTCDYIFPKEQNNKHIWD